MDNTFEYVAIFAIIAFALIAIVASYFIAQGRRRAWADLAERLGLNYESGNFWIGHPVVSGVYQHHQLKLDSFTRSTGKSSTTYTRIAVYLNNAAQFTMTLSQQGMFSKIGQALGMQDIKIGDEEIDQRFVIKGRPEDAVLRVLSSLGMRQRLLEAPALHIEIRGMEVNYQKRGFETDPNKLIGLLDLMCAMADAAERVVETQ